MEAVLKSTLFASVSPVCRSFMYVANYLFVHSSDFKNASIRINGYVYRHSVYSKTKVLALLLSWQYTLWVSKTHPNNGFWWQNPGIDFYNMQFLSLIYWLQNLVFNLEYISAAVSPSAEVFLMGMVQIQCPTSLRTLIGP